jgi:hypothetical protein
MTESGIEYGHFVLIVAMSRIHLSNPITHRLAKCLYKSVQWLVVHNMLMLRSPSPGSVDVPGEFNTLRA